MWNLESGKRFYGHMNMRNSTKRTKTIDEIFAEHTSIDRAAREAVRQALVRHKLLGQSVVARENGQIVCFTPDQIPVTAEPECGSGHLPIPAKRAV